MKTAWLALVFAVCVGAADAGCRQALALGLDVSGSVDSREYRLQMGGVAEALDTPAVRRALLQLPSTPVHLLVYEWSGPDDPAVVLPWTAITGPAVLDVVIATLRTTERRAASPGTALGVAMREGVRHLMERPACARRTLDISGDGKSNMGIRPDLVRDEIAGTDITVNALAIGADAPNSGDARQANVAELSQYFATQVIVGEDSFVETALGFDAYAEAMARKLEREVQVVVLGWAGP